MMMYITSPAGVSAATFHSDTGAMTGLHPVLPEARTSFLARHPRLPVLYVPEPETVTAYQVGAEGVLTRFSQVPMAGGKPVHIDVDPSHRLAVIPSYSGASTSAFPLNEDGSLEPHSALFKHQGDSVHPKRQTRAYAHGVAFHPTLDLAVIADLGSDTLWLYDVDRAKRTLAPHEPHGVPMTPGAGPRHLVFHGNGKWVYVINELDNTISFLTVGSGKSLNLQQRINTLPDTFLENSTTSEIVLHPSGRFLYGSNRGHETIVGYRIDSQDGRLSRLGWTPIGGREPRFVGLDPSGRFMLSANQHSNQIVSFSLDLETGELTPTGHELPIEGAHCIVFVDPARARRDGPA